MTLRQAMLNSTYRRQALTLEGLPVGDYPETRHAVQALADELPTRGSREFSVYDIVDALYYESVTGRYAHKGP